MLGKAENQEISLNVLMQILLLTLAKISRDILNVYAAKSA
jgi:hypothetical protein